MLVVFKTLILCHLAILCDLSFGKCLTDLEEINPKSFFSFREGRCQIIIQSSQRVTHNITSNIFKILLDEVIGYESVKIVERYDYFESTLPFHKLIDSNLHPFAYGNKIGCPNASVNLEIWVNTVAGEGPKVNYPPELGSISTPGRFGWFVLDNTGNKEKRDSIYWKVFQDRNTASEYNINLSDFGINVKEYGVCNHPPICVNGTYTPKICQNIDNDAPQCAVLIAGDHVINRFVIKDIEAFKLYVRVIWVGRNLRTVTDTLIQKAKKERILILAWTPSEIIVSANFTPVSFPPCEGDKIDSPGCKYEYHRLVKSTSLSLKSGAESAYSAVTDMYLNHSHYMGLLETHVKNPNLSHYDIACNWMKANHDTWKYWKQNTQRQLKILGIFPLDSTYNGKAIADAAEMAVEAINRKLLRDMKLHLMVRNGNCDSDSVMNNFIQSVLAKDDFDKTIGILGPACSHTVDALIGMCKYFETVAISYSAEGSAFSDRSKYRYFFRTIGDNQRYIVGYLNLMKRLGWKRIASLSEAGKSYTQYIPHLIEMMENNNLTFIYNSEIPRKGDGILGVKSNLEALKAKGARIIVAHVYHTTAKAVMCEAYRLNMTAKEGYVWFLPQWLNPRWYEMRKGDECTTEEVVEALNGHFSLAPAYFAPDDAIMQENITVSEWKENYLKFSKNSWSDYAGYAYDAVWVFALAYEELYRKNIYNATKIHAHSSVVQFINIIENTDFNGVSGRVNFVSGSTRTSMVRILQWVNHTAKIVGSFEPDDPTNGSTSGQRFQLNLSAIVWFTHDGKQPDDGAEICLLQALANLLDVNCGVAVIVANVMGFSVLGIIVIIAFLITKHRFDKKVQKIQKAQELMKSWQLDVLAPNLTDLDKWEIPRDHLVINRKLNEGAFGTVYGGEAYFHDGGWVAAAVKTLKVNSTTEQKLDFLSEAEIMKKLDHKNIVKLLGVCTKQEPVYTVMEFMLYGDLKTFLLARRHLVNNKKIHEESDEISSKKLTMMALDVARGLSYLAQLKFVHRDIASRNCLINYARVVKIGDFGMTRSMFDSDYYKFSRKGMMPVRWMAPESLGLGIFTPASDIWSYGVLLYEIITFGSFPFQGLSNNQVMEHVKTGNTLNIPTGIKAELEFLMKSCWNLDFKKRPQASEIVEFLANRPRLISPSLDVPLSSVVMEDTGQLELNLPNNTKKLSLTLKSKNGDSESGIRRSSVSHESELPVPPYLEESTFYPNGYSGQNENCPWIPLLSTDKFGGAEGSSRSSSVNAGLGKIITIHRSESCEECEDGENRTHQTSV